MTSLKPIKITDLQDNPFTLIGTDWMLITAGDFSNKEGKPGEKSYNTMTASWGGLGILWNKPVAFVFIRPQRHTFAFTEKQDNFTLSFFDETYIKALTLCGSKSGKDIDKAKETSLSPISLQSGAVTFSEARLVLECKKLYADWLDKDSFICKELIEKNYPNEDFHRCYIAEITAAWTK